MEEKKKKKRIGLKILAIIAMAVAVLAILFLINFARNTVIIDDIISKEKEFRNSTNYSYTSVFYDSSDESNKVTIEHYYKDGKSKMIVDNGENIITVWYDETTKENIFLDEQNKQATVTTAESAIGNELLYLQDEENKTYYALASFIVNSNIDGVDCYEVMHLNYVTYINKEDGTILKDIYKGAIVNGEKCDTITEYKNWQFDKLTEEDVERPDLTDYEVINN